MPGAQEVYDADKEISKWHVRNGLSSCSPFRTTAPGPLDLSQSQFLLNKIFSRFPYPSPLHLYILHDRNLGRKPKRGRYLIPSSFPLTFPVVILTRSTVLTY